MIVIWFLLLQKNIRKTFETLYIILHHNPLIMANQNGKRILCRLLPLSFKIDLRDTSFHISINSLGLYLSPESLSNSLSNLYIPPWLGTIFKFMVFRFLENAFPSQKTESRYFYSCNLSQNSPSGSHHHPQAEGNYSSPQAVVFGKSTFPINRKGGGLWSALSKFTQ